MNLLLKTDIFCTKRCLATVSNNSATTPFSLLVIRNGRQEVHARTLTSVCKSGIAIQTELTWPQAADTPVPVKTNSQTRKPIAIRIVQKTEIPPLLLLHEEVTEVQMLQYPLPVKAVRGTLNPHRPLHLQKRTANQK